MAQLSKCLPFKHEDLSLIPETMKKKFSGGAKACNPSTGEAEAERSLGQKDPWGLLVSLSSLIDKLKAQ